MQDLCCSFAPEEAAVTHLGALKIAHNLIRWSSQDGFAQLRHLTKGAKAPGPPRLGLKPPDLQRLRWTIWGPSKMRRPRVGPLAPFLGPFWMGTFAGIGDDGSPAPLFTSNLAFVRREHWGLNAFSNLLPSLRVGLQGPSSPTKTGRMFLGRSLWELASSVSILSSLARVSPICPGPVLVAGDDGSLVQPPSFPLALWG